MYWYTNTKNEVLYVGKAKNLKARLLSYRAKYAILPKTRAMLHESNEVHLHLLETEVDALVLEALLIQRYQPPYNSLLKDDKSSLYIAITKEDYPKVLTLRKTALQDPATSYRSVFGPYPSAREAKQLLRFCRRLFPFCSATHQDQKHNRPCFYYHLELCPGACIGKINQKDYRRHIARLTLFLKGKRQSVMKELTKEVRRLSDTEEFEAAEKVKMKLYLLQQPQTHIVNDQNLPNLTEDVAIEAERGLYSLLKPFIRIPHQYRFDRIEGYDISHLQGSNSTASMVVFLHGKPFPSAYRRFRMKTVPGINDPAMLVETLKRRLRHPDWPLPDLIVLDGGKSQLLTVHKHIKTTIPIISIVKNPDRIMVLQDTGKVITVFSNNGNNSFRVIQHLRDEAHRFTKKYHTLLHTQSYKIP